MKREKKFKNKDRLHYPEIKEGKAYLSDGTVYICYTTGWRKVIL